MSITDKKCKRKDCRCTAHPEYCCDPNAVAPKEGRKK